MPSVYPWHATRNAPEATNGSWGASWQETGMRQLADGAALRPYLALGGIPQGVSVLNSSPLPVRVFSLFRGRLAIRRDEFHDGFDGCLDLHVLDGAIARFDFDFALRQ